MSKPPYNGNMNNNRKDNRTPMQTTQTQANERIRAPQVRLIDADGVNLGIVNTRDALYKARNAGLDLVAINPNANPVVAKMLDLGKFLYEQKKEQKERARKSRESEVVLKEVQLRPVTDRHDLEIKARNARNFLAEHCKVKVVLKFRGREMSYAARGFEIIQEFLALVGEHRFEKTPSMSGNSITAILMPPKAISVKDAAGDTPL
jgi:translation initiation factor IF-3